MGALDDDVRKAIETISAITAIAGSNFPAATEVRITALGANTASVTLPSYVLKHLLDTASRALPTPETHNDQ